MELNKIYNMDCIKGMEKMHENNIMADCIITDPPYNISVDNNFKTMKGRQGIDLGSGTKGLISQCGLIVRTRY